jgi:MFS family permease
MTGRHRPPELVAEYQRIGRERQEEGRLADRDARRAFVVACLSMIGWAALGLYVAHFAWRVTDHELGMGILYGGQAITVGGVSVTLIRAHLRGRARGDW